MHLETKKVAKRLKERREEEEEDTCFSGWRSLSEIMFV